MKDNGALFYSLVNNLVKKIVSILILLSWDYALAIGLWIVFLAVLNIISLATIILSKTLGTHVTLYRWFYSMLVMGIIKLVLCYATTKILLSSLSLVRKRILQLSKEYTSILHYYDANFARRMVTLTRRNKELAYNWWASCYYNLRWYNNYG